MKEKELAFKATKKVLEAAGILNTASPSLSVVYIVQQNSTFLGPIVQAMLDRFSESLKKPLPEGEPDFEAIDEEEKNE